MSNAAAAPTNTNSTGAPGHSEIASPKNKGKSRAPVEEAMEEDVEEEEEEEEEEDGEEEDDDEEVEESFEEIDPSAIISTGRRTRGVRVDYTSREALEKAGLTGDDDEEEDDVTMKD
ncbi:hypothetical protein AX17_002821 [Amanita inopinata Kibby_2008]|nr:hypothetical protein AX17_002821 [Amanita inopinata Kibby_2008]